MTFRTTAIRTITRVLFACGAAASIAACGLSPEEEAAAIEKGIMQNPESRELWSTIKTEYPQDFDALITQIQALGISGMQDEERVREVSLQWLQNFFAKIGPDTVKAPASDLLAMSAAEAEFFQTMQTAAVEQCAAMAVGQFVLVDPNNAIAAGAMTDRNTAMIRAAVAGRANPQTYAQPTDAEWAQYQASIAATGVAPYLQAALDSDEELAALSTDEKCDLGVAVYTGIADLDDEAEPVIAAYMLAP
ncbi:MAG: hypothetical protein AAF697_06675 [Pseudomonadota bacterium]